MITGIQDVYYNVADMKRAVAFYRDVLGSAPAYESTHWTSFRVGSGTFALHWTEGSPVPPVPRDPHGPHAGATVTLRVEDCHKAFEALKRRGVKFLSGVEEQPWGDLATFEDPDGNVLKLMQPKP